MTHLIQTLLVSFCSFIFFFLLSGYKMVIAVLTGRQDLNWTVEIWSSAAIALIFAIVTYYFHYREQKGTRFTALSMLRGVTIPLIVLFALPHKRERRK